MVEAGRGRTSLFASLLVVLGGCGLFNFDEPTHASGGHAGSSGTSPGGSSGQSGRGGASGNAVAGGAPSSGGRGGTTSSGSGGIAGATSTGGTGAVSSVPSCLGNLACRGESCCASLQVDGCTGCNFPDGHTSTVSTFLLDEYEVTVGRFRNFVQAYQGPPSAGAGAHSAIPQSGWQQTINRHCP